MAAKMNKSAFLKRLLDAHDGSIIRLPAPYNNSSEKHTVKCLTCNHTWEASGYSLTSKKPNGCPKCAKKANASRLTTTLKDFEVQLFNAHGGSITYISGYTKVGSTVTVKCKLCGNVWSPKAISLIKTNPHGCNVCAIKRTGLARIKTLAQFKQEVFSCHGTSISVLGKYVGCKDPIHVSCYFCGHEWNPTPDNLVGVAPHGCPECKRVTVGLANTKTEFTFTEQLRKAHGGKIKLISDYSKQTSNLQFKCNKKHTWWTNQTYALIAPNPSGCPHCGNIRSRGETKLFKFVKKYAPDAIHSIRLTINPETGWPVEWDIYIPSLSLAIEYNGVYYHSLEHKLPEYHSTKSKESLLQHGVRVIHVTDVEWRNNNRVVRKTLKHLLGVSQHRYYARKLQIVRKEKLTGPRRSFYQKNHLQGAPTNGISYALTKENGAIVALMTFSTIQSVRGMMKQDNHYELVRYATRGSVVGGASRLFTAFLRDYNPSYILSYSQNDWFDGALYPLLGFTKVHDCGPDYRTLWNGELRHKSYTRRGNLQKLLGDNFDPDLTERQNLVENNILIYYDSGKIKWEWSLPGDNVND